MLGREMVVISGWVGPGENALCGNGKIPLGSLCLRLLTSFIFQVGLGGGSMGRASFVVKRGVLGDVCCSGMEEDSTPSEERWGYFGLNLAYGQSV